MTPPTIDFRRGGGRILPGGPFPHAATDSKPEIDVPRKASFGTHPENRATGWIAARPWRAWRWSCSSLRPSART